VPREKVLDMSIGQIYHMRSVDRWAFDYVLDSETKPRRRTFASNELAAEARLAMVNPPPALEGMTAYLGGPAGFTLGRMLGEYAGTHTLAKEGAQQELSLINRFLRASHLPELVLDKDDDGRAQLQFRREDARLPVAFEARLERIRSEQARTLACIAEIAPLPVTSVAPHHIRSLMDAMQADGLSHSSRQKMYALLRAAFNAAQGEWRWRDLSNPCVLKRQGKTAVKIVQLSLEELQRLRDAVRSADDPSAAAAFEFALQTTLRSGSIWRLRWSEVDLGNARLCIRAKGQDVTIPLSPCAVTLLTEWRRPGAIHVFDLPRGGIAKWWRAVRSRAGLPWLQFRDMRHVAATALARAGADPYTIKKALGHTTLAMAMVYINLADSDAQKCLSEAEARRPDLGPPVNPPPHWARSRSDDQGPQWPAGPGANDDDPEPCAA
jgi:integrase